MKKAFTMIELIFVIVILGILAAVAIPKLNATRDDAETAKAAQNIATLMSDLASYYTAQGKFADKIDAMTNVPLQMDGNKGTYNIKGKACLTFEATPDGSLSIKSAASGTADALCGSILSGNTAVQNILRGTYTCKSYKEVKQQGSTSTYKWEAVNKSTDLTDLKSKCDNITVNNDDAKEANKGKIARNTITGQINALGQTIGMNFSGSGVSF